MTTPADEREALIAGLREVEREAREVSYGMDMDPTKTANWRYAEICKQACEYLASQPAQELVAFIDPKSIEWLRENPKHRVLTTQLRGIAVAGWMPLYAAPPADDEAVRLLRKARKMWVDDASITAEEIDAYLAKVGKG